LHICHGATRARESIRHLEQAYSLSTAQITMVAPSHSLLSYTEIENVFDDRRRSRGGNHRVVGRRALGVMERPYGLDRLHRPRLRRLGAVPVLQHRESRKLVRLRVLARRRLSYSGRRTREISKARVKASGYRSHHLLRGGPAAQRRRQDPQTRATESLRH
jgi:hypothetical protein